MPWVYVIQRFQRRDRDEGRRDGGRDSGAGADRERQRRERLQQQKRGQWNAYWQDKNAPRVVYNSSVICCALLLSSVIFSAFLCKLWMSRIAKPSSSCIALMHYLWSALLSLEKEIKGFCRSICMFWDLCLYPSFMWYPCSGGYSTWMDCIGANPSLISF